MKTNPIALLTLLLSISSYSWAQKSKEPSPNVIIIYADDLGYGDLSIYGGDIPTPNIDRIGREGIQFTDFYVAAPVCTPSRFGLLTGMYPMRSQHQLTTALMPFDEGHLDETEKTLPEYLKKQHYKTALIGKWHLGSEKMTFPTNHGFDLFTGFTGGCIDFFNHTYGPIKDDWYVNGKLTTEEGYSTELITDHAISFIDEVANEKLFFLYLPYNAPHYGKSDPANLPSNTVVLKESKYEEYDIANTLQAPAAYYDKFSHVTDPYRKAYSAMVSSLDDNVGKILDKLQENGLLENTIIWFISDNGGYAQDYYGHSSNGELRGQKGTLYEGGIRVPGLVMWKNKIKPKQIIGTPVCNVDLLPTFASILNLEGVLDDKWVDGQDISGVLFHNAKLERDLFWKFRQQTALRSGDWKLIDNELYNLSNDKAEKYNVAAEHPEIVKKLQAKSLKIILKEEERQKQQ